MQSIEYLKASDSQVEIELLVYLGDLYFLFRTRRVYKLKAFDSSFILYI